MFVVLCIASDLRYGEVERLCRTSRGEDGGSRVVLSSIIRVLTPLLMDWAPSILWTGCFTVWMWRLQVRTRKVGGW